MVVLLLNTSFCLLYIIVKVEIGRIYGDSFFILEKTVHRFTNLNDESTKMLVSMMMKKMLRRSEIPFYSSNKSNGRKQNLKTDLIVYLIQQEIVPFFKR